MLCIVERLLGVFGSAAPELDRKSKISIELWENMKTENFRINYVQPDVVIRIGNRIRVIIELKWRAPLDDKELAAQWLALSEDERSSSFHILITDLERIDYSRRIESDAESLGKHDGAVWKKDRFRHVTWGRVLRLVSSLNSPSSCVSAWSNLVSTFLLSCSVTGVRNVGDLGIVDVGVISLYFRAA